LISGAPHDARLLPGVVFWFGRLQPRRVYRKPGIFVYNSRMNTVAPSATKRPSGNIFLVGMMGAGKTTVGKLLAKHLDKSFIDCDEELQQRTGVTVAHIFDVEGEAGFRRREAALIHELVLMDNIILATGGGAVLDPGNRACLAQNGLVVYLKGSVQDLWQRTRHDRTRPLLQTADPLGRLKELYSQRDPLYTAVADLTIASGKQSAHHLVAKLEQELKLLPFPQTTTLCKP
jgi:shikimate kinase